MMMNNIEDYQNLFETLKQTLKFYANDEIYKNDFLAEIKGDLGMRAKLALQQIEDLNAINKQINDEYQKNIEELDESEHNQQSFFDMIKHLKEMENGD